MITNIPNAGVTSVSKIGQGTESGGSSGLNLGNIGSSLKGFLKNLWPGSLRSILGIFNSANDTDIGSSILDTSDFMKEYNEEQRRATDEQRKWSAEQAQKQMDFQEYMASTQYQRAVEDMKAAGLNPYMLMAGASANSAAQGSMASTDSRQVYSSNDYLERDKMLLSFLATLANSATKLL